MDDVIIIGGSFAGLAGALQLGRARRKVTVLDTGLPRNRFAGHSPARPRSQAAAGHPSRGAADSWRVIPRSGWSVPGPKVSPAPSTISTSSTSLRSDVDHIIQLGGTHVR
jgi:glycine/D-amino acid oxidase-like deaminating enzyme